MKFLGQVYGRPEQADKIIKKYEVDIQKVEKDASQYVPAKLPYLGPPARRSRRKRRNQSVRPWQNV